MCFYITIGVPREHANWAVESFASDWHLRPTKNPSVSAAMHAEFTPLLIGEGGCCCGLYTSSESESFFARKESKRRKYERLGWSAAKIQRALSGCPRAPEPGDGLHPTVVELLEQICRRAGAVAVVVHEYTGKVETESFTIAGTDACGVADLPQLARSLKVDSLLYIRTAKSH